MTARSRAERGRPTRRPVQSPRVPMSSRRAVSRAAFVITAAVMLVRLDAQPPSLADVLQRAAAYVAAFNQDLAGIVAEERYEQTWRRPAARRRSGDDVTRRELRSDLLLVKPDAGGDWLQYRDVFEVDGVPVRDRVERLTRLFAQPSASADEQAARIQEESARHNIGDIERTLNTPIFALQFLAGAFQARFRFTHTDPRAPAAVSEDDAAAFKVSTEIWTVQYEEVARPTIVRTADDRDVPARGRFWIDPASGRVLMSELVVGDRQRRGTIDVSYQSEPLLGFLVPVEMREHYEDRRRKSRIQGAATYGRFRQFRVDVDEQVRPPSAEPPR